MIQLLFRYYGLKLETSKTKMPSRVARRFSASAWVMTIVHSLEHLFFF